MDLIYKDESFELVGIGMEVHREVGFGFNEKPYERAMAVEFGLRGIPWSQQLRFPVFYKGVQVHEYIPDLTAYEKIILDAKTVEEISDRERGQMLNYLKISGFRLGLIFNFKHPSFQWERVVR